MSVYYIATDDGQYFELDCTEEMSISSPGRLTKYTLQSGASVSDHYINENKTASLKGIITDVKTGAKERDLEKPTDIFLTGIEKVKQDKIPFKFYYRNTTSGGVRYLDNCMFTNVTASQSAALPAAGDWYSYGVDMAFEQVRFSNRARITSERVPSLSTKSDAKATSSASTQDAGVVTSPVPKGGNALMVSSVRIAAGKQ